MMRLSRVPAASRNRVTPPRSHTAHDCFVLAWAASAHPPAWERADWVQIGVDAEPKTPTQAAGDVLRHCLAGHWLDEHPRSRRPPEPPTLTNAMRYARGASTSVAISSTADELPVEVSNEEPATAAVIRAAGSGAGLLGFAEQLRCRTIGAPCLRENANRVPLLAKHLPTPILSIVATGLSRALR
jgi:hypothetical protein